MPFVVGAGVGSIPNESKILKWDQRKVLLRKIFFRPKMNEFTHNRTMLVYSRDLKHAARKRVNVPANIKKNPDF